MANNIAIYGAGGLGKEVACLIRQINEKEPQWNLIGFFDDTPSLKGKQITHFGPCLGGIEVLNAWKEELAVVLAFGECVSVMKVHGKINNGKVYFPNLIHPSFFMSDKETFEIGEGNIIHGGCSASYDVSIGNFNVLNDFVSVGHDALIGSFNSFMPSVRISGNVRIGQCNFFGVGSIVIEKLTIGNNVRLAAGSALMTNAKDGNLYLGVPALKMNF